MSTDSSEFFVILLSNSKNFGEQTHPLKTLLIDSFVLHLNSLGKEMTPTYYLHIEYFV